jgi:hypothetical protein
MKKKNGRETRTYEEKTKESKIESRKGKQLQQEIESRDEKKIKQQMKK